MLGFFKRTAKIIRGNAFEQKKQELRVDLNLVSVTTSLWTTGHEHGLTKRTDNSFCFCYQKKERRDVWPSWHYTRDALGQDNQWKIITILRDASLLFALSQFVPWSLARQFCNMWMTTMYTDCSCKGSIAKSMWWHWQLHTWSKYLPCVPNQE